MVRGIGQASLRRELEAPVIRFGELQQPFHVQVAVAWKVSDRRPLW